MFYTKSDVIEFINENDVKFIRLAFCDLFGTQKNVSIMPSELQRAFDTGISIDASAIRGFADVEKSDMFLVPDSSTMSLLPWRPSHGRVVRFFCNIRYPDGAPFELDSRAILKQAVDTAEKKGIFCNFGAECEFYLFKTDEEGRPTNIPFDNAGYMDIAPEDQGENVRREICLTLEEMGFLLECSHHECGPGQNEIDFKYSDALSSADKVTTFKVVVKTIAARNGLYASFSPKPLEDEDGNGLHINMSPHSIDKTRDEQKLKDSFMAGIMAHVCEMTAFLNPTSESYKRLGSFKAPKYITWSQQNRSQLIRIPAGTGEYERIELRSPDPAANPYIAYALLIYAGLDGIESDMVPPKPMNADLFKVSEDVLKDLEHLPQSYEEAISIAEKSEFIRKWIPGRMFDTYKYQYCNSEK